MFLNGLGDERARYRRADVGCLCLECRYGLASVLVLPGFVVGKIPCAEVLELALFGVG
jgi:hypothetical protein